MSKFDKRKTTATLARPPVNVTSPVATSPVPDTVTHNGAAAYSRDDKSALFLLGLSNMVAETTFYETADHRDGRFTSLVNAVAVADPGWLAGYLPWLRSVANMRSAPLVAAVDAMHAMLAAKVPGSMAILESVLLRPDAPGEALAYYAARYGRRWPIPLKKACARAAARMYTEKMAIKYDTASHAFRWGNVVEITHPTPRDTRQALLFKACIDRAHHRADPRYRGHDGALAQQELPMLIADAALRAAAEADATVLLEPGALAAAGWIFQDALPYVGDGSKVSKRQLWEAVIPQMGWEALLKNLAGFDRAGVCDEVAETVALRLADPQQVQRAKILPYQVLAALEQVPSERWRRALEQALYASLSNIAQLAGRTLVLIDTSASMTGATFSKRSKMTAAKAAAVFGVATGHRQTDADVYGFASGVFAHQCRAGSSLVPAINAFLARTGEVGHGTDITGALRQTFRGHDRVFVFTDGQSFTAHDARVIAPNVPFYVFDLGGYAAAYAPSGGNVHTMGGLSDATFKMIQILEGQRSVTWPWEEQTRR